jgi:hypothetical protein
MRRSQPILLFALVILVATRALVPSGWMPVADEHGIRLVLCSGQNMVVTDPNPHGAHQKGESHEDSPREVCPYGTLAATADLPELPQIASAAVFGAEIPAPAHSQERVTTLHAPRPPPRGPPTLA